jgi:drug/metabolite transporter (DMT)-like permease
MLMILFKYFGKLNVNTFQAITVNYIVAASLGFMMSGTFPKVSLINEPWAGFAGLLGVMFIMMFYVMALSSQKVGVAITTVSNKMSLAIPVVAGILLYDESLTWLKVLGVVGALVAVGLVVKPSGGIKIEKKFLFLPIVIFFGSGALDSIFKYCETNYVGAEEVSIFSASLFGVAAIVGVTSMIFRKLFQGKRLETKSIIAGVALGVPNYFSVHYLILSLQIPGLESTMIFPINNVGIVVVSTILAIILFKEHLSKLNWTGILLALLSIVLIAFG